MARTLRTRFAAPLVMTLAVGPACVVHSGTGPPPSGAGPASGAGPSSGAGPASGAGATQPSGTDPAPPIGSPPPPPVTNLHTWTVFQNRTDLQCYASIDVKCNPKATCNPPPPQPMESCPAGMTMDQPVKIQERAAGGCVLIFPVPAACGGKPACTAPPPTPVDCPS